MEKKQLKALIEGLSAGDKLSVTYLGDYADRSGDFEVTRITTGRGKGGSKLMHLRAADGTEMVTGTPESENILHVITTDGTLHGFEVATDVPRTFETDPAAHARLKLQMRDLVGTTGARIRVEDSKGEFGEEYTVTQAELLRGRYGQVKFTLQRDDGSFTSLWSFRHSGIVTSFEVLSIPIQNTLPRELENAEFADRN